MEASFNECKKWLVKYGWIFFILVLVCLPRFDRNDFLISDYVGNSANDTEHYVAMVDLYKGKSASIHPEAPFTFRPLAPYLASFMQFSSESSLNIINLISLALALWFFLQWLGFNGFGTRECQVGGCLFVFSFPVFYYGTIGIVDPVCLFFTMFGLKLLYNQQFIYFLLVFFLGVFVKEMILLLFPVALFYCLSRSEVGGLKTVLILSAMLGLYFFASYWVRIISLDNAQYLWSPSLDYWYRNVFRLKAWLSLLLSLGVPFFVCMFLVVKTYHKIDKLWWWQRSDWVVGIFSALGLYGLAHAAAWADGRFVWPATLFTIPLLLALWKKRRLEISCEESV